MNEPDNEHHSAAKCNDKTGEKTKTDQTEVTIGTTPHSPRSMTATKDDKPYMPHWRQHLKAARNRMNECHEED